MAENYEKLKAANKDLYITLYDDSKGYSLASKMKDAREKYGELSDKYLSFKRQWDAYKKEYDGQLVRLTALEAARDKKTQAFDFTDPKGTKVLEVKQYDAAAAAAIEQNDLPAYTAAVTAGNKARQEIAAAGYKPPAIPPMIAVPPSGAPAPVNPKPTPQSQVKSTSGTGAGQFNSLEAAGFGSNYTVVYDPSTKSNVLRDGNSNPVYVYTDAANAVTVTSDFSEIQRKMLADAKASPAGVDGLFASFYAKNLISKETFTKKNLIANDFSAAMMYVTQEYSNQVWSDYTYNDKKDAPIFSNWLTTTPRYGSGGNGGVTRRTDITLRQDADKDINEFFVQTIGRAATAKEKEDYFNALSKAEKAAVQTTTTSGSNIKTSGENLTDVDKLFLKGKVAGNAIKGTDIDTILSAGGSAAENINLILAFAGRNGVTWTTKEATAAVADAYRNGKTMDNIKTKIKNLSKFKYQNLAPLLKENDDIDIYDLGQSYGALKSQILELNDRDYSVFDSDIQAALNNNGKPGLMTETEFRQMLKKKPEWRKTKNAREEAASYANDILRSFGLVG
jgi:hypothetical protein